MLVRSYLKKLKNSADDDLPYNDLEKVIKEGNSPTEINRRKGMKFSTLGKDVCLTENSIEADSDLLKLGEHMKKEHKELARDLSTSYIGK